MLDRRPLVMGERMSERHCRLAGLIGQVGVMAYVGELYNQKILLPAHNRYAALLRTVCGHLADGKFIDVAHRFTSPTTDYQDLGHKLGLMRNIGKNHHVIDPNAQTALLFYANQSRVTIPADYRQSFGTLVSYQAQRTRNSIHQVASITEDYSDNETPLVAAAGAEIGYYVKYLEPAE
jgi:hypothetical protein